MKIIGIIPARYASTRFPAKALAMIGDKTMIQRVYEQAQKAKSLAEVLVATDHQLIYEHVRSFGGNVVMTSEQHQSGTDRCQEAYQNSGYSADYVINIQGDEPFIQPQQIDILAQCLAENPPLATLVKKITDTETLLNPNTPKVIINQQNEAVYFSRQTIPYLRGIAENEWLKHHIFFKHIGIYAYRSDVLENITKLSVSSWEKVESLEQLRWLENGYKIKVAVTEYDSHGIDTPEDLQKAEKKFL
jgi:3-deoxy-manno-octulosonate cytidylyltransferase (CMP-KDO synthetase)